MNLGSTILQLSQSLFTQNETREKLAGVARRRRVTALGSGHGPGERVERSVRDPLDEGEHVG